MNKMRFPRSGSPNARRHRGGGPFHFRFETPRKIMSVEAVPKNSIVQALLGTTRMRTTCQDMVFPTLEFVFEFRHHLSQFLLGRCTPASTRSKGDCAWRQDSRAASGMGQCVKIEACFRCRMQEMHEAMTPQVRSNPATMHRWIPGAPWRSLPWQRATRQTG